MLIAQQSTPADSSSEMVVRCGWGFCTIRYVPKTSVQFPALQGKDISHMWDRCRVPWGRTAHACRYHAAPPTYPPRLLVVCTQYYYHYNKQRIFTV